MNVGSETLADVGSIGEILQKRGISEMMRIVIEIDGLERKAGR